MDEIGALYEDETDADIDLTKIGEVASTTLYESIQNAANGTDRSKQQQDFFLGVSNLGHCRNYAALMTKQTPPSDERDKTAAFIGTVLGDALEQQIKKDHPEWLIQEELMFPLPSGGEIPGHSDIIVPSWAEEPENGIYQGVWDLKSKAELEAIRKYGPNQQQIFQIHAYAKAAIEKGLLDPEKPIVVQDVFYDRSGKNVTPYAVAHLYHQNVIDMIDEWVGDVTYAVIHNEEASKDMPVEWCMNWCEYATVCRGTEPVEGGLITDPDILAAVDMHREAQGLEKRAKELKRTAKIHLEGVEGSTGEFRVKSVWVNPVEIAATTRAGYTKIDLRPVPKPKGKKGESK